MPEFTLRDYLDIEATVGPEEDEEVDEEEFEGFFVDEDDDADTTSENGTSWRPSSSPAPTDFTQEAAEIRARFARRQTGALVHRDEALLYRMVPRVSDPALWSVRVWPGYESEIVLQIAHRTIRADPRPSADITSAFAREGIPGYVFLEGDLPDVAKAVRGIFYVFGKVPPRLVPLEQRVALLAPHNPLSDPIEVGQWVRCLHGPYRNDIGFVCGHRPYRDAETAVALVPRIPEKKDRTGKRKRGYRPEPRSWTCEQLEAAWGKSQVRRIGASEYMFRRQNYESGLLIMILPPASLAKVDTAPNDLRPFLRAPLIRDIPSFWTWVHRVAQDSIKPGQWVKVESGDHRGAIGKPRDIMHSVASLALTSTGNGPDLLIPLCALAPLYRCGDNVKCRWSESCGLVTSVDEVEMTLTYVEKDSNNIVTLPVDALEPHDPPPNFFRLTMGTWVEFTTQREEDQTKRRGYIKLIEGTQATVFDEHSFAEFKIETRELEVSRTQAPSLPKNDPIHPLTGQRVVVVSGPLKGLYGNIREVGAAAMIVEITAFLAGTSSPRQSLRLHELMIVSKELELSRSIPPPQRQRTPSPGPPPRASTPEPTGHWLFTRPVQSTLERKCIPFIIRGMSDRTLDAYDGKPARTVPIDRYTINPREGEVIVRTIRRSRPEQISINPYYLEPWSPLDGCEVVVTGGSWLGSVGTVKGRQEHGWIVTFTVDDDALDVVFAEKELAVLEALK